MNQLVGNCPKCGAPIWAVPSPTAGTAIPQTVFTCECRNKVEVQPVVFPWITIYPLSPSPQPVYPSYPVQPFYPYIGPIGGGSGQATCKLPGTVSVYTAHGQGVAGCSGNNNISGTGSAG